MEIKLDIKTTGWQDNFGIYTVYLDLIPLLDVLAHDDDSAIKQIKNKLFNGGFK